MQTRESFKERKEQEKEREMHVPCPDCKKVAELADDFSYVKCAACGFDMTYGEYVKYIAYRDARYKDILGDYKK
ncbi:hypothetical protein [Nitrososphaera sp.]|uniref:hypothetical protein n=1 Tax=Nitrososphaera sp. TaxID=1971748 RepID=UPI00307F0A19